ncbi:MAG TPA: hypothetical protein VNO55_05480 [Polyangia bacterium]|nr:hypothetical protein [Polyangia bacterium]
MLRRLGLALALVIAATPTLGCGSDDPPTLDSYFADSPYGVAACDAVDNQLQGQREIQLYVNGTVNLSSATQGLQRYYRRHGLQFFATRQPQSIPQSYALDYDNTALNAALAKEFPGVDVSDDQALMKDPVLYQKVLAFAVNYIFKPLVDFATAHSTEGTAVTNLVMVPHVARAGGTSVLGPGEMLAGLSLSPALLAEFVVMDTPEGRVWQGINLPPSFTPMVFLDASALSLGAARDPVLRDLIAAHEFGHSAGLVHRPVQDNLMSPGVIPGVSTCGEGLDPDQIAKMKSTLFGPTTSQALTLVPPPGAPAVPDARPDANPRRFLLPPEQFPALLRGDPQALRTLAAPFMVTLPSAAAPTP